MRLSTSLIYSQGYDAISRKQGEMQRTQQQIASGTRIATPADDPVAAARLSVLARSLDQTTLYASNVASASSALQGNDAILERVGDLLARVRTLAVNGGSATLSAADRKSIGVEVASELADLVNLANSRDASGKFVFAGHSIDTQPFTTAAGGGVTYAGDQGQRDVEVAPSRFVAVNLTGSQVFMEGRNGDGQATMRAAAANAGSGVIAPGAVANPAAVMGHTYALQFTSATTFDVVDMTAATTLSTGNAYVEGGTIAVGGMQTSLRGAPAAGDSFTLAPSTRQSLFATLQGLVDTLALPTGGAGVANGIAAALQDLDQGIENVISLRAQAGAHLRELDSLGDMHVARTLADQASMSGLADLDYNKALSDFARQQVALQAAQQSFVKVSGLSLFDYLKV